MMKITNKFILSVLLITALLTGCASYSGPHGGTLNAIDNIGGGVLGGLTAVMFIGSEWESGKPYRECLGKCQDEFKDDNDLKQQCVDSCKEPVLKGE
jgi:hypothetical protein